MIGYGFGVVEAVASDHLDVLYMFSGFAAIFTGIAVGALDEAADYPGGRSRPWVESGDRSERSDDPLIHERYGELWVQVQSAVALTSRAVAPVEPPSARYRAVLRRACGGGDAGQRGAIACQRDRVDRIESPFRSHRRALDRRGFRSGPVLAQRQDAQPA